eukprot:3859390-Pyramimonas_sp.AAC.1
MRCEPVLLESLAPELFAWLLGLPKFRIAVVRSLSARSRINGTFIMSGLQDLRMVEVLVKTPKMFVMYATYAILSSRTVGHSICI